MIMRELIKLADMAALNGEVPVAACITDAQGNIITSAHNQVEAMHNATMHAEILAIGQACQIRGSKYLTDCTLHVTLEPCAMCAGAIAHAKIGRVIFGAYDPKGGAIEHGPRLFSQPTCHHAPEIIGGIDAEQCGELLQKFFANMRKK